MPYTHPWNEATPLGNTTDADTIDTIFQDLKFDLRERLEQVIPSFGTNTVNPKKVKLSSGNIVDRPVSGDFAGDVYIGLDNASANIWDGAAWVEIGAVAGLTVGLAANRPNPPVSADLMYFATDTGTLSISDTTPAWIDVNGGGTVISGSGSSNTVVLVYHADNAVDTRAGALINARAYGIVLNGTTDANGQINILASEMPAWGTVLSAVGTVDGTHTTNPRLGCMTTFDAFGVYVTVFETNSGVLVAMTSVTVYVNVILKI